MLRKRTKSIKFDNAFRSLMEPLNHLSDSNGWQYGLPLNVYKYMLETEYGLRVSSMYLGQVHPCLARARLIEVPCMKEELELIVDDQMDRGEAISGALPDARFALPPAKERHVDGEPPRACAFATDDQPCFSLSCKSFRALSSSPSLAASLPRRSRVLRCSRARLER